MENINSVNNFNISQPLSHKKAEIVQEGGGTQAQPKPLLQQNTPQMQSRINAALIFDTAGLKMDNEAILKYLQSLMNLPPSIDKFTKELCSNPSADKLLSVINENMINIKALCLLLERNSNTAADKLLQTIAASLKSGVEDISQLKEILGIIGTIQSVASSGINPLKELILLYIPVENNVFDKKVDYEASDEEKEAIKNSKLSIMLKTLNFSNILCAINEEKNNLFIDFYCSETFAKEKFSTIISTLSKEANINSYLEFKKIKENKINSNEQNFAIVSDGFISANVLIFSHLIIKTIFQIDKDITLLNLS